MCTVRGEGERARGEAECAMRAEHKLVLLTARKWPKAGDHKVAQGMSHTYKTLFIIPY